MENMYCSGCEMRCRVNEFRCRRGMEMYLNAQRRNGEYERPRMMPARPQTRDDMPRPVPYVHEGRRPIGPRPAPFMGEGRQPRPAPFMHEGRPPMPKRPRQFDEFEERPPRPMPFMHGERPPMPPFGIHRPPMRPQAVDYEDMDTVTKIIYNIRELGHAVRNVGSGQAGVLKVLFERGGMTQRELTSHMDVQSGTASELIMKLERAGLIRREMNPDDRRTAWVTLTEEGEARAHTADKRRENHVGGLFDRLSEDEKGELLILLEKLNAWNAE